MTRRISHKQQPNRSPGRQTPRRKISNSLTFCRRTVPKGYRIGLPIFWPSPGISKRTRRRRLGVQHQHKRRNVSSLLRRPLIPGKSPAAGKFGVLSVGRFVVQFGVRQNKFNDNAKQSINIKQHLRFRLPSNLASRVLTLPRWPSYQSERARCQTRMLPCKNEWSGCCVLAATRFSKWAWSRGSGSV